MAAETLTIVYQHACNALCERFGQEVHTRPTCVDGVALIVRPECIASGAQLVELRREVS